VGAAKRAERVVVERVVVERKEGAAVRRAREKVREADAIVVCYLGFYTDSPGELVVEWWRLKCSMAAVEKPGVSKKVRMMKIKWQGRRSL
jgi:hypothetical protein